MPYDGDFGFHTRDRFLIMGPGRSALDSLASALHGFLARVQAPGKGMKCLTERDVDVIHFRQKWPDAACMMTIATGTACQIGMEAWTTVLVVGDDHHVHCDGRPAYLVTRPNGMFDRDLSGRCLVDRKSAVERYGARLA